MEFNARVPNPAGLVSDAARGSIQQEQVELLKAILAELKAISATLATRPEGD